LVPPAISTAQLKPVPVSLFEERVLEGIEKELPPGMTPKNFTVLVAVMSETVRSAEEGKKAADE
jgi:hypothetical protein